MLISRSAIIWNDERIVQLEAVALQWSNYTVKNNNQLVTTKQKKIISVCYIILVLMYIKNCQVLRE